MEGAGGGGGSVLVLPFHSPINCLAHFACQIFFGPFTLFFAFSPTSELGPILLKKFIHLTNDSLR